MAASLIPAALGFRAHAGWTAVASGLRTHDSRLLIADRASPAQPEISNG